MQKTETDRINLKFSAPDPTTNIIKVLRLLPDNQEEIVGRIYPHYEDDDTIKYTSVNNAGEVLLPPTFDFTEIEQKFHQSVMAENEKSFHEEMEAKASEIKERKSLIQKIRWSLKSPKLLNR